VRGARPHHAEIDSLDALHEVLVSGHSLSGRVLQSLDLSGLAALLIDAGVDGTFLLGCTLSATDDELLRDHGALVFPKLDSVPFNPYQPHLYTAEDLYGNLDEHRYSTSFDARTYAWSQHLIPTDLGPSDLAATMAASLHDHAMSDALDDWYAELPADRAIGLMGGHADRRGSAAYARSARLAGQLTRDGLTVVTGGGPGAMEAANLGARLADRPDDLDEAIGMLATIDSFAPRRAGGPGITAWARVAFEVLKRWPGQGRSIGIPTWFYGHEPPNVFATGIAKFFSNALREDILLQRCRAGIIYLPGAAGTVQEIFQAATRDYYAEDASRLVPLVLVGREYWSTTLPAWPLLQALGEDRAMESAVYCVDSVEAAADLLAGRGS
jgi:predicted Rossmann-fold nucleotide-binding protein